MRTLLLDLDIIAFAHAAVGEIRVDWDGDRNIDQIPHDFDQVAEGVDRTIAGLVRTLKADAVIVCLSCPSAENFRLGVYPQYKSNRVNAMRPLHLAAAKTYAADNYPSYARPTLEADDVMTILATAPDIVPGERVIVSEDKDLQGVPGLLHNPRKDKGVRRISEQDASRYHLYQTVIGDSTDGYPGAPGVGPAKAGFILTEGVAWSHVVRIYVDALSRKTKAPVTPEQAHEAALVQARVARMVHNHEFDRKKKQVILWEPRDAV